MTDESVDDAVSHFTGYVRQFHDYYRDRPEFQERLGIWREVLDRYSVPGGSAIDMGCGTGIFSFYLAEKGARGVGVDGAPDMVQFCEAQRLERGMENIRFMEGRLPAVDESQLPQANLLISSSVIEYVPDLDSTLALFARLVVSGGHVILSMPNAWCISRTYERAKYAVTGQPAIYKHILHFTSPAGLQTRVRRLGLTLVTASHYTHYTRLAKLTRRMRMPAPLTEDLFVAVFRKE
jgi:2-polyprenyl-6-hydroxyphenyl methylase/3-demethylubiquinone-9 3-methyltransferase